jgi:hypothetical protein
LVADLSLTGWPVWVLPGLAAAAGAAGAALVVSRLGTERRREPPPPATEPKSEPQIDPFVIGSAAERRNAYRRQGNPVEVSLCEGNSSHELLRGWVIDRSLGGLCLLLPQAIAAGTILNVRPANAGLGTLMIQIEIRSCRQKGKEWEAGCRFIRTPNWSQLLQFG